MAKRNSIKIPGIVFIRIIVFLFIGFVLMTGYVNAVGFLTSSPLFAVKEVMVDRSIQFIDMRSLKDLKGSNIFKVNIQAIDRQINRRYPYIAQLRVVRQLPDRILVLAKKREPLMQVYFDKKYLVLDAEAMALYYTQQPEDLPQVYGVPVERLFWRGHLHGREVSKVIDILGSFKASAYLRRWRIDAVEAGNPSKIDFTVSIPTVGHPGPQTGGLPAGANMHVILDQDITPDKIQLLQMMVSSNKIDLGRVRYIDLRFKEPVIADTKGKPDV